MKTPTMNEDEFNGDRGKTPEQVLAEVEQMAADMAQGDSSIAHEDKPAGYGTLLATYEWRPYPVPAGMPPQVRAWCLQDGAWMTTTLKVDPRYGKTTNKHTRGEHAVEYDGRPVLAWECRAQGCGQWVVQ